MARRFEPAADSYGVEVSAPREAVSTPAIGTLRAVTGLVTIKRAVTVAQASAGDAVYLGDVIETGADGSVTVVFVDGNAFYLRPSTVMVLDEFVFNPGKASNSALFRILRGAFAVIAGKLASGGRLIIETPLGQIQSKAPGAGFGSLAFGILTFNLIHELKAATLDPSPTGDGEIDLNWLQHGAFIVWLNNGQSFVADDIYKTYSVPRGGGSVQILTNTPQQLDAFHRDFLSADNVHQAIVNDVL